MLLIKMCYENQFIIISLRVYKKEEQEVKKNPFR